MVAAEMEGHGGPKTKTMQVDRGQGLEFVDLIIIQDPTMPPDQSTIDLDTMTLTIALMRVSY